MSPAVKPKLRKRAKRKNLTAVAKLADGAHAESIAEPSFSRKQSFAALAAVVLCTAAVYAQVARHPFVSTFDDGGYVTENPYIQTGLTWKTVSWAMTAIHMANWHPLTWVSHALDIQLFGLDPAGHHLTNLFLHLANAVLLYFLIFLATRSAWRSLLVAALFSLHPLNVESVAWVAERKNVLSTLFFFLALGAYGWYVRKPGVGRYMVLAGLFLLGLASKPMVITLPFVLILLDFWPLERFQHNASFTLRRSVVEKVPLFALSAASAAVTLYAQSHGAIMPSIEELPLWLRLENAIYAYAMYIEKAFWPASLAPIYPLAATSLSFWQVGLSTLFLALVSYYVWGQRATRPYLLVGWLWFLGTLIPVIGIVQVGRQAMADRYAYIPLVGIFVMMVWGVAELAESLRLRFPAQVAVSAAILALLAFLTWRQTRFWGSNYDLWAHTLSVTQDNPVAEANMGATLVSMGRMDDAVPHFQNELRLNPRSTAAHFDLAAQLQTHERLQEAITEYEIALQASSDRQTTAGIFVNLWTIYTELHDYARASQSFELAGQANPRFAAMLIPDFERSVTTRPNPQNCFQLGQLLEHTGQLENARSLYQRSLQLDSGYEAARQALARLARK